MRRGMNPEMICNEENEVIGISLDADFCSEHEWGIKGIKAALGIPLTCETEDSLGIKARATTVFNEEDFFFEQRDSGICLTFESHRYDKLGWNNRSLKLDDAKDVVAAWDKKSFGVVVSNKDQEFMLALYEAFGNMDVAIWKGSSEAFKSGGLYIFIVSRIPEDIKQQMFDSDLGYFRLKKATEATNIREILKEAGKDFFALRPRWTDGNESKGLEFFLNPKEQDKYNTGWFTLDELLEWAQDRGPVIKQ